MSTLIFGTTYVDTKEKARCLKHWLKLNLRNQDCDILVVDSNSPLMWVNNDYFDRANLFSFTDNIGHLARGGKDGWGRAFCYGLEAAIIDEYDYVAHIEGDSLFRLPINPIIEKMKQKSIKVLTSLVRGTRQVEHNWVETGLIFLDVNYIKDSNFIKRYNWENGSYKKYPNTPEVVIYKIIEKDLHFATWNGIRDDRNVLTVNNLKESNFDWITHCKPEVFDLFAREALNHGTAVRSGLHCI